MKITLKTKALGYSSTLHFNDVDFVVWEDFFEDLKEKNRKRKSQSRGLENHWVFMLLSRAFCCVAIQSIS